MSAALLVAGSKAADIRGYVVDAETGEALAAANVFIKGSSAGTTADVRGYFEINVADGTELTAAYVGYTPSSFKAESGKKAIEVRLQRSTELRDVNVYGSRTNFGVQSSQMSAQTLSATQIKQLPTVMGEADVMKSLQKLPGVQSSSDGAAGIYVRGGNYDQNLITLDGSTLYNGEHLKGFISSIIPDMVDNVTFYKGAFPARYGSRLSSVVDVGLKDGDFENYHGNATIGMLSAGIHVEGPIWKGHTSFNIAARASYFNAIMYPMLKNIYDKPSSLQPYSKMNYYDINAKLVHRFSDNDRLTAVVYWGKDVSNASPSDSYSKKVIKEVHPDFIEKKYMREDILQNSTKNNWHNLMGSLYWTHMFSDKLSVNVNGSVSSYNYFLQLYSFRKTIIHTKTCEYDQIIDKTRTTIKKSSAGFTSKVNDASLSGDFRLKTGDRHDARWGVKLSYQWMTPMVDAYRYEFDSGDSDKYIEPKTTESYSSIGKQQELTTASVYAEDDWSVTHWLKANIGLRYSLYAVTDKTYHSIEPRASLRFLLTPKMALKLSYSRMSQGIHMLSSSNITMPSNLWVPVTKDVPLMRGNQYAAGFTYEPFNGIEFSVEGYYKTIDNIIQYRNGATYMAFVKKKSTFDSDSWFSSSLDDSGTVYEITNTTDDWQSLVVCGKGRSYGLEFMAQKKFGKVSGWVSYTWSKSFRTFDLPGEEINGGEEFFDPTDRRHNFNATMFYKFHKHWTLSASWTYQSGRRGNLPVTAITTGNPMTNLDSGASYFKDVALTMTYKCPNSYKLPDIHHLDIGITYNTKHRRHGESEVNLSIYNLYNQKNVSYAFIGFNETPEGVMYKLKGVCIFPFMPSISYKFIF